MGKMKKYAYCDELSSGKVRVRVLARDERGRLVKRSPPGLAAFDSWAEAQAYAAEAGYYIRAQRRAKAAQGRTVRDIAQMLIAKHEGRDSQDRIRSIYYLHIDPHPIADQDVNDVLTGDIARFRDDLKTKFATRAIRKKIDGQWINEHVQTERPLSAQTRNNVLTVLRVIFRHAKTKDKLYRESPFQDLERDDKAKTTEIKKGGYPLRPAQLRALMRAIPGPERWMIGFAACQGLRAGELVSLHWRDVHMHGDAPHITVRYGGTPRPSPRGLAEWPPTKGGEPRTIPLLAMAIECLRGWKRDTEGWWQGEGCWAHQGLVFPGRRGGYRQPLHLLRDPIWKKAKADAGVPMRTRFHDLRHTCATSLLQGWWGEKWIVKQVQEFLGHADEETTQRYLHADREEMDKSAQKTRGISLSMDDDIGDEGDGIGDGFWGNGNERHGVQNSKKWPRENSDFKPKVATKLATTKSDVSAKSLKSLAPPGGFEPPAFGLGSRSHIQETQSLRPSLGAKSFPRSSQALNGVVEVASSFVSLTAIRDPKAIAAGKKLVTKVAALFRSKDWSNVQHESVDRLRQKHQDAMAAPDAFAVLAMLELAQAVLAIARAAGVESEAGEAVAS